MKDICEGVIFSADIIKSPSFSRCGLSRTIMNSLFPFIGGRLVDVGVGVGGGGGPGGRKVRKASIVSGMESNWKSSVDVWL